MLPGGTTYSAPPEAQNTAWWKKTVTRRQEDVKTTAWFFCDKKAQPNAFFYRLWLVVRTQQFDTPEANERRHEDLRLAYVDSNHGYSRWRGREGVGERL